MSEHGAEMSEDFGLVSHWAVDVCSECGAPIMLGEGRALCPSCRALPLSAPPARIDAGAAQRVEEQAPAPQRLRDVA
jgi:uncharacterized Zn finger protein (UPF0148 family)